MSDKNESIRPASFPINTRVLGIICILAAILLYIGKYNRDAREARADLSAAREILECVTNQPVHSVFIEHSLENMDVPPILFNCPPVLATNLLASICGGHTCQQRTGTADGNLFLIHVVHTTNMVEALSAIQRHQITNTVSSFRAVRLTEDQDNAYFALISDNGEGEPAVPRYFYAPGAGKTLGGVLAYLVEKGGELSKNPKFMESFSNRVERALSNVKKDVPAEEPADLPQAPSPAP